MVGRVWGRDTTGRIARILQEDHGWTGVSQTSRTDETGRHDITSGVKSPYLDLSLIFLLFLFSFLTLFFLHLALMLKSLLL